MRIIECDRCGCSLSDLPYYTVKARRINRSGEIDKAYSVDPFELCFACMSLLDIEITKRKREYDLEHMQKRV